MQRRFANVLEYIDAHSGEDLALDTLSGIAHYSRFHFHRQFSALLGMSVHRYVLCTRMKRASWLLAFRTQMPVGEIAATCGYDGPEAFARAFRTLVGKSPTGFRAQPDWPEWNERFSAYLQLRRQTMPNEHTSREVSVVDFPATPIGLLTHRGDLRRLNESIRRFIDWRKRNGLPPRLSATYNILFDDPEATPTDECRYGLGVATTKPIEANDEGMAPMTIPAGRCARLRHTGSDDHLEHSVRWLYGQWLPASGLEPRDFPLFLQRVSFYPDVPERDAVTDIFLPLRD
jgi:AraC family transcriptional regulator